MSTMLPTSDLGGVPTAIVLVFNGQNLGPYTPGQVQAFLRSGQVTNETPCWVPGATVPSPLGMLPGFGGAADVPANPGAPFQPTGSHGAKVVPLQSYGDAVPAGFLVRAVALLVDGLIASAAIVLLAFVSGFMLGLLFGGNQASFEALVITLQIALVIGYSLYFLTQHGATPGKMLFGLRVVDTATGGRPSVGQALLRETVGRCLSALLFIGYLIVLARSDRRALHDMLAGTAVLCLSKTTRPGK